MTYVDSSVWETACDLLERWRTAAAPPPQLDVEDLYDHWLEARGEVRAFMKPRPARERLNEVEGEFVDSVAARGPIEAHAVAWELDELRWPTFSKPWAKDRVIDLADGELFPVTDWNDEARPLADRLPRPWQTTLRHDELPHVRRHQATEGMPAVRFNGTLFDELGFLEDLKIVSAITLNDSVAEFNVPAQAFPIEAVDPPGQSNRAISAALSELAGPAGLVVFPELSVPEDAIGEIQAAVAASNRNVVVVAGSAHRFRNGVKSNVSSLISPAGDVVDFPKRRRFWNATIHEGIHECTEPFEILVAHAARVVVMICKDFMTPELAEIAARCGANLLAVPSMSGQIDLHDISARLLAARSHAVTVVANGPRTWGVVPEPGAVAIGRPERQPNETVKYSYSKPAVSAVRCDILTGAFS